MPQVLPIAAARERRGISVPDLAAAIGISLASCWDLLEIEDEINIYSLRELFCVAQVLGTNPLALVPDAPAASERHGSFAELAERVGQCCVERKMSAEQFGDLAGWDVQTMLATPDSAFDGWCLNTLRDVCGVLGLHWPDFLIELTPAS